MGTLVGLLLGARASAGAACSRQAAPFAQPLSTVQRPAKEVSLLCKHVLKACVLRVAECLACVQELPPHQQ